MKYLIRWKRSTEKDFRKIPKRDGQHIRTEVLKLCLNPMPHNSKKLQDTEYLYRLRFGQYRVIYHFKKRIEIITIVKIKHRKDIYR